MIPKKNDFTTGSLFQFSPYIIFLITYGSLYYYTLHTKNIYNSTSTILAGLPLFAAFIATIYAFFTFKEPLKIDKKIEIFLSGVAHIAAINCYFDIIFIAILNHMLAKTNGILTAVTLSLLYIPTSWIMPVIFLTTSIFSIIILSLPAAIIIFMPIAYGIAQSLQINSAFMAATIIGGSLFGTHLSLYLNDFTISKPFNLKNVFQKTFWFVITAAITTLFILSQYQCPAIHPTVYNYLQTSLAAQNYISIIPYCFLIITSILRINLLANLTIACCIALTTEIIIHKILFLDAIATMFHGFYKESMVVNILFLHLIIAGLIKIIKYNGGFNYMMENLKLKKNQSSSNVQASIILITMITNLLVIIDTLCLNLITHPIRKFANRYNVSQNRVTSLLHITTTTIQTILPYASIMFVTIHITHSSYLEIIKYMVYPILITIITIISIFF
jgi:Na+/H+ antiporter NhaC